LPTPTSCCFSQGLWTLFVYSVAAITTDGGHWQFV
jgi:hypothetical protein